LLLVQSHQAEAIIAEAPYPRMQQGAATMVGVEPRPCDYDNSRRKNATLTLLATLPILLQQFG